MRIAMTMNSASAIQIHHRPQEPSASPAMIPETKRISRPMPATPSDQPDMSRSAASFPRSRSRRTWKTTNIDTPWPATNMNAPRTCRNTIQRMYGVRSIVRSPSSSNLRSGGGDSSPLAPHRAGIQQRHDEHDHGVDRVKRFDRTNPDVRQRGLDDVEAEDPEALQDPPPPETSGERGQEERKRVQPDEIPDVPVGLE